MNDTGTAGSEPWREALDCVDEFLARAEEERPAYLAGLERTRPELFARVRALLDADARASQVGFMNVRTVAADRAAEPAVAALRAGERLGPYRIERELGKGGMGEVWLAQRDDGLYQGQVAIKTLHPYFAHGAMRDRFLREAELLGKLTHQNIARLLDAGVSEGVVYLVLEYVSGEPLDVYCDARQLGVAARLELFASACAAVAHAHANLVVHRDIKPSNILVSDDGHVKLLDFGIGKLLAADDQPDRTELTRITGRVFTPDFAAPEQILGEVVTTATDVYALGVLLYVLLAGVRPFSDGNTSAVKVEHAVLHDEPRSLARAAGDAGNQVAAARATTPARLKRLLEGDLADIVSRALRKIPADRYASVAALSDDVQRWLRHEPVLARAGSRAYRFGRFVRRHRVIVAASAAVVLAATAGVVGVVLQAREARAQARVAELEASKQKAVKDFVLGIFNANSARHPDGARARLTTAEELLDVASRGVLGNPPQQPEVRDELLDVLGNLNVTVDKFELAESLLRERVRVVADASGTASPAYAEAQLDLAHLLYMRSRTEEGNALTEATLAAIKTAGLENTLLHGRAEYERGFGAYMQGSAGISLAAVEQSQRAVRILEALPPSPELVAAQAVLARNYQNSKMLDEAIAADQRAVALAIQVLGPRDPLVSESLRHASRSLAGRFRIREAEEHLARAAEIAAFIAGPDSLLAVETEMDRAHMMVMRGGHRELAALEGRLLPRAIKVDGADGDQVQIVKFLLGTALLQIGDIDRSRQLISEAITVSERQSLAATMPAMLRVRAAGALVQGHAAAALADVDRALAMSAKMRRGPPNYRSATMLATRAEALIALGRHREARAVLADATRVLEKGEADPVKPFLLLVQLVEASADLAERRPELARATAQRVLATLAAQERRSEFWVTEEFAHRQLAAADFALGNKGEACRSLDAAIGLRTANALATDPRLLAARREREACGG